MGAFATTTSLDLYRILQVDPAAHANVIQGAYRALARMLHPDQSGTEATEHAMAQINHAYEVLRDPARRQAYDVERTRPPVLPSVTVAATSAVAAAPVPPPPIVPRGAPGSRTIDFGRYRGWSLEALAGHDPDYLEWLRRHSAGIGYRRQIDEVLARIRPVVAAPVPASSRGWRRRR